MPTLCNRSLTALKLGGHRLPMPLLPHFTGPWLEPLAHTSHVLPPASCAQAAQRKRCRTRRRPCTCWRKQMRRRRRGSWPRRCTARQRPCLPRESCWRRCEPTARAWQPAVAAQSCTPRCGWQPRSCRWAGWPSTGLGMWRLRRRPTRSPAETAASSSRYRPSCACRRQIWWRTWRLRCTRCRTR